jgi:D-alanine-D-alanine ligase
VAEALAAGGFDVVESDIRPDDMSVLDRDDIDVFFLALHGRFGEDGRLQQVMEDRGLIYTGCGPEASRLAFDKVASKRLFAEAGVDVAPSIEFTSSDDFDRLPQRLASLGSRFVVKPIREGSSVGVHIVDGPAEAATCARAVYGEFGDGMIEAFISGCEITVGVLDRQTLPIIEIRSKSGFYDYQAKYVDEQTEYLFDTIAEPETVAKASRAALVCFDALGCRDFARVDFIVTADGTPYALEVNTIPGFTSHSLLPKAAAKTGLSMSDLCGRIVRTAFSAKSSAANR